MILKMILKLDQTEKEIVFMCLLTIFSIFRPLHEKPTRSQGKGKILREKSYFLLAQTLNFLAIEIWPRGKQVSGGDFERRF